MLRCSCPFQRSADVIFGGLVHQGVDTRVKFILGSENFRGFFGFIRHPHIADVQNGDQDAFGMHESQSITGRKSGCRFKREVQRYW